jgi:hypothetical protein
LLGAGLLGFGLPEPEPALGLELPGLLSAGGGCR